MRAIAIIPARGGSKRIPRKNVREFLGKPIIAYSIDAALQSELFAEVIVSTDDEEIAAVSRSFGASVPFMRSARNADDHSTTDDVVREVLAECAARGEEFDIVCCIYATSPLICTDKLMEGFLAVESGECDSAYTIVAYSFPIQRSLKMKDGFIAMNWPEHAISRSQDLETIYHDAGQFYLSSVEAFHRNNGFNSARTRGIVLNELGAQDLDTETDWQLAEMKYRMLRC